VVQMPHAVTHQDGGSDEINVQGLSGVLRDLQRGKFSFVGNWADFPAPGEPDRLAFAVDRLTIYRDTGTGWQKVATAHWDYLEGAPSDFFPAPHAETHEEGGADAIDPNNIGANWNKLVNVPSAFPPSAHGSTHRPGGSDALPTAAPAPITEGQAGAEGSSTSFARADHVHQTPSEWTPKEHGNEKHNPDFLALDGSNKMTGDLFGLTAQPLPWLARFVGVEIAQNALDTFRTLHTNILAYNTLRGGSVAFSETPDGGVDSYLFDGTGSYVHWSSYSLPLSIEVTFWQKITYNTTWVILFRYIPISVDFTLEYYDPVAATWKTIVSKSGWTKPVFAYEYTVGGNGATKLRLTITGTGSAGAIGLCQIAALNWAAGIESYSLPLAGGDMYGDIDMHGREIKNVVLETGVSIGKHHESHENGGADEINVNGLSGQLADYQKTTWNLVYNKPSTFPPSAHRSSHEPGASDEVRPAKWVNVTVWGPGEVPPSSWANLDLSSHIGSRRAIVLLKVHHHGVYEKYWVFRPSDETDDIVAEKAHGGCSGTTVGGGSADLCGYVWVATGPTGVVQFKSNGGDVYDYVKLLAYIPCS